MGALCDSQVSPKMHFLSKAGCVCSSIMVLPGQCHFLRHKMLFPQQKREMLSEIQHQELLAQGTCGYFKLFCHILSHHWQPHVNRCFVSTRHLPSPPRLIIQGQAPARLLGAGNRLVYLDWPDLHAMTHIQPGACNSCHREVTAEARN